MDDLNVQYYSQPVKEGWLQKVKNFLSIKKIIFLVLGIVVLVEVIISAKSLIFPSVNLFSFIGGSNQKNIANITLTTSQPSYKVNDIVPVLVKINAGGYSLSGVDLIINFDPKMLDIKVENITKGKVFDEYPLIAADAAKGQITISAINSLKKSFVGSGQFVQFNLQAKAPGKTTLTIDHKKDSTADSNLMDMSSSKDVLETVNNLEIIIK